MQYLLDTVKIDEIEQTMDVFPIKGITSNPSIIKAAGKVDFFTHFRHIREIIGTERSLHIQVTAPDAIGMLAEANAILKKVDGQVFIKIPVTEQGVKAIMQLKKESINVTATAIYTKAQAFTALEAGADYLALYYNRMENMDIDPTEIFSSTADMIDCYDYNAQILGASFKNMGQVNQALDCGAHAVTLPPSLLHDAMRLPMIQKAVDDFHSDWVQVYGETDISQLPV